MNADQLAAATEIVAEYEALDRSAANVSQHQDILELKALMLLQAVVAAG